MEKDYNLNYIKDSVPKELIYKCEEKYKKTGIHQFLFSDENRSSILQKKGNKSGNRNDKINRIIDEKNLFYISDESEFNEMPSIHSYYDTETKLSCRHQRYKYIYNFIKSLGLEPNVWNLGPEYEQNFSISSNNPYEKFTIRLKPNFFITILYNDSDSNITIYNGFFNKTIITNSLSKYVKNELHTN